MRTLVDLLNDATGYVRIYADQTGFGYERSSYEPYSIGDLFDRMSGYSSVANARAAALLQLQVKPPAARRNLLKSRGASTRTKRSR